MNVIEAVKLMRKYRKVEKVSQAELAARTGHASSAVSVWERNLFHPRLATYINIANALGYEIDFVWRKK